MNDVQDIKAKKGLKKGLKKYEKVTLKRFVI
jgi:hypothetical protein